MTSPKLGLVLTLCEIDPCPLWAIMRQGTFGVEFNDSGPNMIHVLSSWQGIVSEISLEEIILFVDCRCAIGVNGVVLPYKGARCRYWRTCSSSHSGINLWYLAIWMIGWWFDGQEQQYIMGDLGSPSSYWVYLREFAAPCWRNPSDHLLLYSRVPS